MIDQNSKTTREFIRLLFVNTHNESFIACSLDSIKNENNMKEIIDYINNTPNITVSMIEEQIQRVTS